MSTGLCCAYLRVYQPVEALSAPERALVERTQHHATAATEGFGRYAVGLIAPHERREIYEKIVDGETFYCPSHTRLRTLLGLLAFERSNPDSDVALFFSREELRRARSEIEAIERMHPGARPSVVQSAWHVPSRWFSCFDDTERVIECVGDHPTIRYETRIADARRRIVDALDTLTGGIVHPVIIGMIYELREWLASFDPRSLLELDYASVSTLFDADELADDRSAAEIRAAISALAARDGAKAGLYYQRVQDRWARPRARQSFN